MDEKHLAVWCVCVCARISVLHSKIARVCACARACVVRACVYLKICTYLCTMRVGMRICIHGYVTITYETVRQSKGKCYENNEDYHKATDDISTATWPKRD